MQDLKQFTIQGKRFVISWEQMSDAVWLREQVGDKLSGIVSVLAYSDGKYLTDGLNAEDFINNKLIPEFNKKMDQLLPKDDDQPQFDSELDRFKWLVKNKLTVVNDRFELEK